MKQTIKQFLKPSWKKLLLAFVFFGYSSYIIYHNSLAWRRVRIGFPIKYYLEEGWECCMAYYQEALPVYLTVIFALADFLIYYLVSSVILFIFSKLFAKLKRGKTG